MTDPVGITVHGSDATLTQTCTPSPHLTCSTTDMDMPTESVSSVVTLTPYVFSSLGGTKPKNPWNKKFGSQNEQREILRGICEPTCYNKFLSFEVEDKKVSDLDIFEVHRLGKLLRKRT